MKTRHLEKEKREGNDFTMRSNKNLSKILQLSGEHIMYVMPTEIIPLQGI